jgi:hypothetical protein
MIIGAIVFAAGMYAAHGADNLIACHEEPTDKRYWAWREIDGRRCWFRGSKYTAKYLLFWGSNENVRRGSRAADRQRDRLPDADRDPAPVNVTVPPWAPEPMKPIGEFERRWRELMLDLQAGPYVDPKLTPW